MPFEVYSAHAFNNSFGTVPPMFHAVQHGAKQFVVISNDIDVVVKSLYFAKMLKCPGLTCGINIVKPRFLFKTVVWKSFGLMHHLCITLRPSSVGGCLYCLNIYICDIFCHYRCRCNACNDFTLRCHLVDWMEILRIMSSVLTTQLSSKCSSKSKVIWIY